MHKCVCVCVCVCVCLPPLQLALHQQINKLCCHADRNLVTTIQAQGIVGNGLTGRKLALFLQLCFIPHHAVCVCVYVGVCVYDS